MSDAEYTNLDLDTAEQLLLDAGRPDEAEALRHYQHGIRNMMLGVVAPGYLASMQAIVSKSDATREQSLKAMLREEFGAQGDTLARKHDEVTRTVNARYDALGTELNGIQSSLSEVVRGLGKLTEDVDRLKADNARLHQGQAQLSDEHRHFREGQDRLISTVTDQGETISAVQEESKSRWIAASKELSKQRELSERKDKSIRELARKIEDLNHAMLGNEIGRPERLRNLAFLDLLMRQYPDLAAEAERIAAEAERIAAEGLGDAG